MLASLLLIVCLCAIFAILGALDRRVKVSLWSRLGAVCMGMAFAQAALFPALIVSVFSLGLLSPVVTFAIFGVPYYVANAFVNPKAYQRDV